MLFLTNEELKIESTIKKEISRLESIYTGTNIFSIQYYGLPWWGSLLSWIIACQNISMVQKRKFRIATYDNWRMVPKSDTKTKNWRYYFSSLSEKSNDSAANILPSKIAQWFPKYGYRLVSRIPRIPKIFTLVFGSFNSFSKEKTFIVPGRDLSLQIGDTKDINSMHNQVPDVVKSIFKKNSIDQNHWNSIWKSYLARELFKPNTDFEHLAQAATPYVPAKYIAIHCRWGDKVAGKYKEADKIETIEYLNCALSWSKKLNINDIFLVTDAPDFIKEFEQLVVKNSHNLKIYYDASEMRHDGFPAKIVGGNLKAKDEILSNEMITALKNTHILSKSDFLIGSNASWFFQFAFRLRVNSLDLEGRTFSIKSEGEISKTPFYHF
jgi:hypothetical protein